MSNLNDLYFKKFIGQRLKFYGILDGYKKISKKLYRVCFIRVYEVHTGKSFRQHVNILCKDSEFKLFFKDFIGTEFQFTAEIYNYTKNPHGNVHYRTFGVGLKDINKITQLGVAE